MNTLTLTIHNLEQLQHGVCASHQFGAGGGTIGSLGADWQLIDREQRIQPIHCEIRWIENSFCALDRCGQTFLNDSLLSLGRLAAVRLREGDCLRMGAYRLLIHYQQVQQIHRLDGRSIEELFDPQKRVLDALTLSMAPDVLPASAPGVMDIYQAFDPGIGCDPLAALQATPVSTSAPGCPLELLIAGERP